MYRPDKIGIRGYDLLGDIFYRGCDAANLIPDKVAAATWYQSAAVLHVPEAQWKLGKMFYEGDGIPQNKDAGLAWITSAAIEGSMDATNYLAEIGEAVPSPVSPNTYTVEAEQAKIRLETQQAAERQRIVQDLSGLLVTATVAYTTARADTVPASPAAKKNRMGASAPTVAGIIYPREISSPVVMTRPVYCSTYGSARQTSTDTVTLRINAFCY